MTKEESEKGFWLQFSVTASHESQVGPQCCPAILRCILSPFSLPLFGPLCHTFFLSSQMDSSSLILTLNPWACFQNYWEMCFIQKGTSSDSRHCIRAPAFMPSVPSSLFCIGGLYSQPVKIVPFVHQIPCPITAQGHWSNSGPFLFPTAHQFGVTTFAVLKSCMWLEATVYQTVEV